MNDDQHFKVISVSAWCDWHTLENSRLFGEAVVEAIVRSDSRVAIFASGSLSHRFQDDGSPQDSMFDISREFYRQVDLKVLELWASGRFDVFTEMLPGKMQKPVRVKVACMIPPCCSVHWVGIRTGGRSTLSPIIFQARVPASATWFSRYRDLLLLEPHNAVTTVLPVGVRELTVSCRVS
ncbi:MAG: hypothetical protein Ct9H300mP14_05290 [Gammaproteobacteria bacterium]|nr:MAG: hypothetical protein Ct9H300mP14_05290 [Gammaproteobacteria bacterium]